MLAVGIACVQYHYFTCIAIIMVIRTVLQVVFVLPLLWLSEQCFRLFVLFFFSFSFIRWKAFWFRLTYLSIWVMLVVVSLSLSFRHPHRLYFRLFWFLNRRRSSLCLFCFVLLLRISVLILFGSVQVFCLLWSCKLYVAINYWFGCQMNFETINHLECKVWFFFSLFPCVSMLVTVYFFMTR